MVSSQVRRGYGADEGAQLRCDACVRLVQVSRSLYRYQSRRPLCAGLRERISEIAAVKRRYGYRRVYVELRREGWLVNRTLTCRLYREAAWPFAAASANASVRSNARRCPSPTLRIRVGRWTL